MNKELKQQMKQDEIVSGLEHGWKWLQANREMARTVALVVVGAAVIIGGVSYFQSHRAQVSTTALEEALVIYERPLAAETAGTPGVATFPTAKDKYTAAAAAFDGVERAYPTLQAGLRARYYGALCRIELGDFDTARKTLQTIAERGAAGTLEPTLAHLALADIDRRSGAYDKAIATYKEIAGDPASPLPRESTLMSLAATLEDAKRTSEAAASYRDVVEQFPGSVFAPEARRRAAYLSGSQS